MHAEPTVILEVDKRLARFIRTARPSTLATPSDIELGRWQAALEVRRILQDACPYGPTGSEACRAAWFCEKYGADADAVADVDTTLHGTRDLL